MNRSLNALSSQFRPLVFELLARLTERGVAVQIVQTLRTPEQHAANLASGASKVSKSKHLPRRLRGAIEPFDPANLDKADAIDICPYETYQLHGPDKLKWNTEDPAWDVIGEIAESLGLRWGGRWKDPHDPGHAELILSEHDRLLAAKERLRA